MKVAIVGLGLIGGSMALDLREKNFATSIIGVEPNEDHQTKARNRGLVEAIEPLSEALKDTDLVLLAVPVDNIVGLLPQVLNQIGPHTTVTDMGSTKQQIVQSVRQHPRRAQYVASHPMAGTENSGPLAAVRQLFKDRTVVICDSDLSSAESLRQIDKMYDVLGMRKVYMSASEHDLHAAYISHLSHISSFVLANTVLGKQKNVHTIFDMAGGGFESTVRLAKSSPEMWGPIFNQNSEHVISALEDYIHHLQKFHASLVQKQPDQTKKLMSEANQIRAVLQSMTVPGK